MKESLPRPPFDQKQYERPAQSWICGHSVEGNPCRLGPSPRGRCQATLECTPLLETSDLSPTDLADFLAFAARLAQPNNPVSDYLLGRLSSDTRAALAQGASGISDPEGAEKLKGALLKELNAIIRGPTIYDPNRFRAVPLSEECAQLAKSNPQGAEAARLNKWLLEQSYPTEIKPSYGKGRYRCTRPRHAGGPCESGPLPNGRCSRPVPPCTPIRSLRSRRALFSAYTVAFTATVLLLALAGPWRAAFINPGALSLAHSGPKFIRQTGEMEGSHGCSGCHGAAAGRLSGWIESAAHANPFDFAKLGTTAPANMSRIDAACQNCHRDRDFHQPNIDRNLSCSACHREHLGAGPMRATQTANCVSCHGDVAQLEHWSKLGRDQPPHAFAPANSSGLNIFPTARPASGYTQPIHSFVRDHPEFQVGREKLRENNQLRFNHQFHLTALAGTNLACASCHNPDPSGAFHRPITFQANCQGCHSLQFDVNNPGLTLPHGNPAFVRAFLRSLPTQYANYATRTRGLINRETLDPWVRAQLDSIKQQAGTGELLEEKVFFSSKRWGPVEVTGRLPQTGRSLFYGCAYCHEVTPAGDALPKVTPPSIPDRWMLHSSFNHAKHRGDGSDQTCLSCHQVRQSSETAEILLPSKRNCTQCHSPHGGVSDSCLTCHEYHRRPAGKSIAARTLRVGAE